jgi:hypothetical protein
VGSRLSEFRSPASMERVAGLLQDSCLLCGKARWRALGQGRPRSAIGKGLRDRCGGQAPCGLAATIAQAKLREMDREDLIPAHLGRRCACRDGTQP